VSQPLDAFFDQYYDRNPVNATFTGLHEHDARLPDWSADGLADAAREMNQLRAALAAQSSLDALLACANLEVRLAEQTSGFMVNNPALWTGEAIFGAVSLMLRPFAARAERLDALAQRLQAVAPFLSLMRVTLSAPTPERWTVRAQRECSTAQQLFGAGLDAWLALEPADATSLKRVRAAATQAQAAFQECAQWLAARATAPEAAHKAGAELFAVLLRRGHFCERPAQELLGEATELIASEKTELAKLARQSAGSWERAERSLADNHPAAGEYYSAFSRTWDACRKVALEHDLVSWPDWPIRYLPIPRWAREAAAQLYWLYYRSPAPLDPYSVHDYLVAPIEPEQPEVQRARRLRTWNYSVIKLNHVVHHGALGHHVQNWHATHRSRSRVGTIAAVDCASRIGMFLGGSLAEGWACYATELMDEHGFLTPLERVAQQHSRVRLLARAIVDIRLHTGDLSPAAAVQFYVEQAGLPAEAAEAEVSKNTMFPCTALMYWLGTQGILDLRAARQRRQGAAFRLRSFHDDLLSYGAIPVPLIARLAGGPPPHFPTLANPVMGASQDLSLGQQ
jgi:hypothetical protein